MMAIKVRGREIKCMFDPARRSETVSGRAPRSERVDLAVDRRIAASE